MNIDSKQGCALITGAAKRLGKAMCVELHRQGYDIIVHYRHSESDAHKLVETFCEQRKQSAKAIFCDLDSPESYPFFIKEVLDFRNRLDVLVNNASLFIQDDDKAYDWGQLLRCNVEAPYRLSLLAFEALKQSKGSIVNLTDRHAESPLKDFETYCMTKSALWMQTKCLAKRFAPFVRVNAIAPGAMLQPVGASITDEIADHLKTNVFHRLGGSIPVVQALSYLIGNEFVTGTALEVDGGYRLASD